MPLSRVEELVLTNKFVRELRPDPVTPSPLTVLDRHFHQERHREARIINRSFFTYVLPVKTPNPRLRLFSPSTSRMIELEPSQAKDEVILNYLCGNRVFRGISAPTWSL
jgi:uncharacterized protein YdiU (UPF0061 family)